MDDSSISSDSDTIAVHHGGESGSSSSQNVRLLECQSQTISKSIIMATNATILDGTFLN